MKSTLKKLINKLKKIRGSFKRNEFMSNWKFTRFTEGFNVEVKSYGIDKETREFRAQVMVGDINYLTNYYFTSNEGTDAQKLDRCVAQAVRDYLFAEDTQQELKLEEKKDEEAKPKAKRAPKAKKDEAKPEEKIAEVVVVDKKSETTQSVVKEEAIKEEVKKDTVESGKVVGIVYDRGNVAHTKTLLCWMNKDMPQWKADPNASTKIKNASNKLLGSVFMDEKGEILDSFKKSFSKETGFPSKR
jgi:hypothetical protein